MEEILGAISAKLDAKLEMPRLFTLLVNKSRVEHQVRYLHSLLPPNILHVVGILRIARTITLLFDIAMPGPFIDTPRTERGDQTHAILDQDFSEMPSFIPPSGADDLMKAVRNKTGRQNYLTTPSARNHLAQLRNPNTKPEFTPLLQSAVRNQQVRRGEYKQNGIATPAAMKPGFQLSSPALPEVSEIGDDNPSTEETPIPIPESSSAIMSTPIPTLPQRGELGLNGDGGNVLTLKEQEAVSMSLKWSNTVLIHARN